MLVRLGSTCAPQTLENQLAETKAALSKATESAREAEWQNRERVQELENEVASGSPTQRDIENVLLMLLPLPVHVQLTQTRKALRKLEDDAERLADLNLEREACVVAGCVPSGCQHRVT